MTTIDPIAKTVTRKGSVWSFKDTGSPRFYRELCEEFPADIISAVLTGGDYYPPMLDPVEKLEIHDLCMARLLSLAGID